MTHFLTIEDGQLYDYAGRIDPDGADETRTVVTPETLPVILASHDVLCSSSIDFPTEYTSDPAVLAMVTIIQENR